MVYMFYLRRFSIIAIDEFVMGYGKQIEVECDGQVVTVRDFGRGIPLREIARLFE